MSHTQIGTNYVYSQTPEVHWLNSELIPRLLEMFEFRKFFMTVLSIIENEVHRKILRCVGVSVGEFCARTVVK